MEEPQQKQSNEEEATLVIAGEEATLVSPRFDDEETLVARPVVPLEEADASAPLPAGVAPLPQAAFARRPSARRQPGMLALVLVSVLVGSVLGGAGLYLYQRQSQDDPTAAATRELPSNEPQQPAPAPSVEPSQAAPPEAPAAAEVPATTQTPDERTAAPAPDTDAPAVREPVQVPAVERRDAGTPRRGKKGEVEESVNRPAPHAAAPRAPAAAERETRRVESIVYRPRRAPRRERIRRETVGDVDRLRRIFEGTPE